MNSEIIKLKKDLLEKNRAAPMQNVLITGETGVGKELFAEAVHEASRKDKSYLPINCAAIAETLLEQTILIISILLRI